MILTILAQKAALSNFVRKGCLRHLDTVANACTYRDDPGVQGPGHEAAASDVAQPDGAAAAADGHAAPDPYMRILLHGDAKATKVKDWRTHLRTPFCCSLTLCAWLCINYVPSQLLLR